MMKRLLTTLALLALSTAAYAQSVIDHEILRDYNLNSTSLIYACLADPTQQAGFVRTAQGGGTTLTSLGLANFGSLAIGDVIIVKVGTTETRLLVGAILSATTITVSPSSTLWNNGTGYAWTLSKFTSGTSDSICWTNIEQYSAGKALISIEYNQGDLGGGLDFRVEGKTASPGALPHRIYPSTTADCVGIVMTYGGGFCNLPTASAGIDTRIDIGNLWPYAFVRVGMLAHTSDPSDAGANIEKISVFLRAENPR
jgi:hypothetical protein